MDKEKSSAIFQMTEKCFDSLEAANALIDIVLQTFEGKKSPKIVLEKANEHVKDAVETILQIQQDVG